MLRNYRFYVTSSSKFKVYVNTVSFVAVVGFLNEEKK